MSATASPTQPPIAHSSGHSHQSTRAAVLDLSRKIGLGQELEALPERVEFRHNRLLEQYQSNLEAVVKHAVAGSNSEIASHELDPDWWHQFSQLAEQIHNPKMQKLWGQILTVELAQPRSFGFKALDALKRMNHRDAQLLLTAVSLSGRFDQDPNPIIVTGWRSDPAWGGLIAAAGEQLPLTTLGLPYSAILTLRELGLLHAVEMETGTLPQRPLTLQLRSRPLQLQPQNARVHLRYYRFSHSGEELSKLLQQETPNDYIAALLTLGSKALRWS
ncbi:TIGR03899 family protein [Ferrimonas senticii]|uniref:TIGR03899 family protein n=1 Tax=Ferrimonas senticii TaxID=394566 RepID=UPI0004037AA5|nr:TIGR03899 family protein [Ferrimonas senticii]